MVYLFVVYACCSHVGCLALPPLEEHLGGHVRQGAVVHARQMSLVVVHLYGEAKIRDLQSD